MTTTGGFVGLNDTMQLFSSLEEFQGEISYGLFRVTSRRRKLIDGQTVCNPKA
jgi:hypothetical protein